MTDDTEYEGRRSAWNETSTAWLNLMMPTLHAHAARVANGVLGVLGVNVETDDMQVMLTGAPVLNTMTPRWHPVAHFVAIVEPAFGPATARRWARMVTRMNPTRDLALFVHNEPDMLGRWYARFLIVPGDRETVH
jgi:hypothetical protein